MRHTQISSACVPFSITNGKLRDRDRVKLNRAVYKFDRN